MTTTVEDLEQAYGSLAETGRALLGAALKRASWISQPVDVMHVLVIVAQNPWPTENLANSPAIRRFLGDIKVTTLLRNALATRSAFMEPPPAVASHTGPLVEPGSTDAFVTVALDRCLDKARARWPGLPLTDAMIVWAILDDANPASAEMAEVIKKACPDVSLEQIVRELDERVQRAMPDSGNAAVVPADHTNWMPKQHMPHPTIQHHVRHETAMADISDAIEKVTDAPERRKFVLVSGLDGSPLHEMWRLLPDAVEANPEAYGNRNGVWIADISDYLTWADPPIFPGADRLLVESIQYVQGRNGLLLLEHIEKLRQTSNLMATPLQRELLGQLREIPGALIVALYETQPGGDPFNALVGEMGLNDGTAEPVPLEVYSAEHALKSIRDYFAPVWKEHGFVLDGNLLDEADGPFADILALADGARFGGEPMAFPYLLVKLTEHLMKRRGASSTISTWAKNARERIGKLAPPPGGEIGAQVTAYYGPRLKTAVSQASRLVDNADFGKRGDHYVITRAHLTATFLGSAACEFVYPARAPDPSPPATPVQPSEGHDNTVPLMRTLEPTRSADSRNQDRTDSKRHDSRGSGGSGRR